MAKGSGYKFVNLVTALPLTMPNEAMYTLHYHVTYRQMLFIEPLSTDSLSHITPGLHIAS